MLGTGAVSGQHLPLPRDWKIPVRHPVGGYRLPPQEEDASVEVLFELPVPDRTVTIEGLTVRYETAGRAYRKTFPVTITVCAPADPGPCDTF